MNYIVLDLEWNQSMHSGTDKSLVFEIIEIGAVKLNGNFQKIGTYQKLIKPVLYKRIHPIISNITSLYDSDFKFEKDFKTVFTEFINWCGEDYVLCTYGSQDLYELQCNINYHNCENPWKFPLKYIDVQKVFNVDYTDENEQMSLENAAKFLNVKQKNVYHRALGDAIYTAEILKKLNKDNLQKYMSLDHYNQPATRSQEKEISLGTHNEFVTCSFSNRETLINYSEFYITKCPVCYRKCRKKIRWFSDGSKYVCVAKCEEHGLMEGIINIKKTNGDDRYFGIRKVIQINDEKYLSIVKRKENIIEKRRIKRKGGTS